MKKELMTLCFSIACLLTNLSSLYCQSTTKDSTNITEYYILIDASNPNFDIKYNKSGHPIKISMFIARKDLDCFKIVYDPINTTVLFNGGHSHTYKRKDQIGKLIDYNWLMESQTVSKIIHRTNKHKVFFIQKTEDEKFWSVYETGIVIEME
jgi:hypothetical protein